MIWVRYSEGPPFRKFTISTNPNHNFSTVARISERNNFGIPGRYRAIRALCYCVRARAAELGYSDDDDVDDEDWAESSEDEYIGLIPMLCARCVRAVRRHWFDRRAKHFLVVFNVFFCVRPAVL